MVCFVVQLGLSVNKLAWMLMEVPVFLVMIWMWWYSTVVSYPLQLIFLFLSTSLFSAFVCFPVYCKEKGRMPVISFDGSSFIILNGFMQGEWIFYLSPADRYTSQWFAAPQFILGTVLFCMGINCHSDYNPASSTPGIPVIIFPSGGLYHYVTSANYFGEIVSGRMGHTYMVSFGNRVFMVDFCQSCTSCQCYLASLSRRVR